MCTKYHKTNNDYEAFRREIKYVGMYGVDIFKNKKKHKKNFKIYLRFSGNLTFNMLLFRLKSFKYIFATKKKKKIKEFSSPLVAVKEL